MRIIEAEMRVALERFFSVTLMAALAVLGGVSIVAYWTVSEVREVAELRRRASLVLVNLSDVVIRVNEAESSVRGFLLSGDESSLDRYHHAVSTIDKEVEELREPLVGNPDQLRRLEALGRAVAEHFAYLRGTVARYRRSGTPELADRMTLDDGERFVSAVRTVAESIEARAEEQFARHNAAVLRAVKNTESIIIIGNLIALVVGVGSITMLRYEMGRRRRADEQREEHRRALEQSNMIKTYFAATMAHEMRNIFGVIVGFSDLLAHSPRLGSEDKELVDALQARSREGLDVIRTTLEISRSEVDDDDERMEDVSVRTLIEEIRTEIVVPAGKIGLDLAWEIASGTPETLRCDPLKLKMVLKNLLTNAIKFTKQGEVRLLVSADNGAVRFQVSDTGIGIPREQIATLFDPFRQAHGIESRRAGGVGLGLYIVARLLALMNGTISVDSEVGRGTRFTIRLPGGGAGR